MQNLKFNFDWLLFFWDKGDPKLRKLEKKNLQVLGSNPILRNPLLKKVSEPFELSLVITY